MTDLTCDVAIIGAGTAGLAAERSARSAGAKTLLIDEAFAGTTCASVGCMPSKLLIAAAHAAHDAKRAHVFGVETGTVRIDGKAVFDRVRRERDRFVEATKKSIEELPDGIGIKARARFVDAKTLALSDGRTVSAKAIVIATGSTPSIPKPFEPLGDLLLTNETVFELHDLPASVAVIGAGPLGLELAQALARLGVRTEVFDEGKKIGGLRDAAVAAQFREIIEKEVPIRLGVKLQAKIDGNAAVLNWTGSSSGEQRFERVLVATGRPPQFAGLDLDTTGLELDKHGTPVFNRNTLQCGSAAIFLAGDVDADVAVLHEASAEGAIAGRNAAHYPQVQSFDRSVAFAIMFTDPPVAVIGKPRDKNTVVGCASYADQGRAKVEARNAGLVHLYADPSDGRLTGAEMAAPGAEHTAHLIAWAIERGETATQMLKHPFYHPTLEEGLKSALREICKLIDAPASPGEDQGAPSGA